MAKAAVKRWIASNYVNSIVFRKITAMDERYPRGSFHDSWADAHDAIVSRNLRKFETAQRELAQATRALAKARAMTPPNEDQR